MGGRFGAYREEEGRAMGKHERKRQFSRPSRRFKDIIQTDLQEIQCGTWNGLIWLRIGTGGGLLSTR
jgi:hypothetical protein